MMRTGPLLAGIFLALSGSAWGEVALKQARWFVVQNGKARRGGYRPAERWVQPPAARLSSKPRAVVTVVNRGPKPEEGVLLRYAISARLFRAGETGVGEGLWTVPFWVEERRVPRLKANEVKDIPIDSMLLITFLKRTFRAGFWLNALKIQVMVEPRIGDKLPERILEEVLPVDRGESGPESPR